MVHAHQVLVNSPSPSYPQGFAFFPGGSYVTGTEGQADLPVSVGAKDLEHGPPPSTLILTLGTPIVTPSFLLSSSATARWDVPTQSLHFPGVSNVIDPK